MSRDAIAELVHRYADGVVRRDKDQWAAVWAEDSTWVLGPGREVKGKAAIVDLWVAAVANFSAIVQVAHNGTVTLDGTTGSGRWYISEHYRRADGTPGILLANYDDTYVLEGGEWLFASRQLTIQYSGAPDLSAPFLNSFPV